MIPEWLHGSSVEIMLQSLVIFCLFIILTKYSSVFEEMYHEKLIDLYMYPWWRILIVILILFAVLWSPRIAIILSLVVFFYMSDMNMLITPLPHL